MSYWLAVVSVESSSEGSVVVSVSTGPVSLGASVSAGGSVSVDGSVTVVGSGCSGIAGSAVVMSGVSGSSSLSPKNTQRAMAAATAKAIRPMINPRSFVRSRCSCLR